MAEETELAWAAGLFDGEGSIKAHLRTNGYTAITMVVSMCNEEAIKRFHRAVGVGKVTKLNRRTKGGLEVWRWLVCSDVNVRGAVELLKPYLCGDKLRDAELALDTREAAKASLNYGRKVK